MSPPSSGSSQTVPLFSTSLRSNPFSLSQPDPLQLPASLLQPPASGLPAPFHSVQNPGLRSASRLAVTLTKASHWPRFLCCIRLVGLQPFTTLPLSNYLLLCPLPCTSQGCQCSASLTNTFTRSTLPPLVQRAASWASPRNHCPLLQTYFSCDHCRKLPADPGQMLSRDGGFVIWLFVSRTV